jgi:transposase-like protein
VFVKINGETRYLWRAVDHEGEVLEFYVTKRRDRKVSVVRVFGEGIGDDEVEKSQ